MTDVKQHEYDLLNEITRDSMVTQANLSDRLGIAVGDVNWHIKRLKKVSLCSLRRHFDRLSTSPGAGFPRTLAVPLACTATHARSPRSAAERECGASVGDCTCPGGRCQGSGGQCQGSAAEDGGWSLPGLFILDNGSEDGARDSLKVY